MSAAAAENKWAVAYGNMSDGHDLVGPFDTPAEAIEYASNLRTQRDWRIVPLINPTCWTEWTVIANENRSIPGEEEPPKC